jgi:hypothetical protein
MIMVCAQLEHVHNEPRINKANLALTFDKEVRPSLQIPKNRGSWTGQA